MEAQGLVKSFDGKPAVRGIDLAVPEGSIYGILGPNGAGKTTTLRMLLGIIEPDEGSRVLLGHERPLEAAKIVGYLPEERGLYPAMTAKEAIAFMGALRGLPLETGRKRAEILLRQNGLGDYVDKPIKSLSKGMAQTIQLFGTIVHQPKLIVLDEPFSGLDAINQGRLEHLIRDEAAAGTTVIFSTHVIHHAERLCERIAIIADGQIRFEGLGQRTRATACARRCGSRPAMPTAPGARRCPPAPATSGDLWQFELPKSGIEPLLKALIDGGAGIEELSIERSGLHDAFVAIAGEAAAREMESATWPRISERRHDERVRSRLGDRAARFRRRRSIRAASSCSCSRRCSCSASPSSSARAADQTERGANQPVVALVTDSATAEALNAARARARRRHRRRQPFRSFGPSSPAENVRVQARALLADQEDAYSAVLSGTLERPVLTGPERIDEFTGSAMQLVVEEARRTAALEAAGAQPRGRAARPRRDRECGRQSPDAAPRCSPASARP